MLAYAVGAGAAATGLLTSSLPAHAEIIFKPTNISLHAGNSFPITIEGATQFTLTDKFYIITGSFSTALLSATAGVSAAVVGHNEQASALKAGAAIGPPNQFQAGKALLAGAFRETQISQSVVFGQFANTTNRYLGLKFSLHGQTHYGWARFSKVNATANSPSVIAILTGYAFETVPNTPIRAGETSSAQLHLTEPQLRPGTATSLQLPALGLLALGSPALDMWRRPEE